MPSTSHSLLNYLRVVVGAWRDDPRDDAELLARFAESDDEAAFKALVCRHGPLVWRSCTRVLGDGPDAEDAFQTVFLALAHKAGGLRREPLAGWLHRAARLAALDARAGARRRRGLEQRLRAIRQPVAEEEASRGELYAVLDEEMEVLPERLRVPLVLRYLDGKTLAEVARTLGCSITAATNRLARGEAILRERLTRRGLGVSAVTALLTSSVAVSAMPPRLIGSTVQAAVAFRSGSLIGGASETVRVVLGAFPASLETMIMRKSLWIVLACCLGLMGAGLITYRSLSAQPDEPGGPGLATTQGSRQSGVAARVDYYGDPLPSGALARMGTVRQWYGRLEFTPKTVFIFSPDDKTLISQNCEREDGFVCLWNTATGRERRWIVNAGTDAARWPSENTLLALSPDGKTLAKAQSGVKGNEGTVYLWEIATGKLLHQLKRLQEPKREAGFVGITFLPNGKILTLDEAKDGDNRIYLWDAATGGREISQLKDRRKSTNVDFQLLAFSRDGEMVAAPEGANEKTIHLWEVATGKKIRQLQLTGEEAAISSVTFSPDGKTLAAGGPKLGVGFNGCVSFIRVWDVASGKSIHRFKVPGADCCRLAYSPDGKTLVGGPSGGHLWDVATGKKIRSFGWENAKVAVFSPNGKTLAVGDEAGVIRLWDVATGKEILPHKGHQDRVISIAYSPDGKTLASLSYDKTIRLWEAATGKELRQLARHAEWTTGGSDSLAYSPDGKILASMDNMIHLWDTATNKEIRRLQGQARPQSVVFSPDGKLLAATMGDHTVCLWQVATGQPIYTLSKELRGGASESWSVVFSPDGRILAVPGKDSTISLWEVATGKSIGLLQLKQDGRRIGSLAFSPDGRILATSSLGQGYRGRQGQREDDKAHLWEVATGKEIGQLNGRKASWEGGWLLTFSPDGRILATVDERGNDKKIHLWEVASGKEIGQLGGHRSTIRSVAFSPDGKTLASGSDDLTCLVWDVTPFGDRLKPTPERSLPAQALSKERLEAAWADLAKDPAQAYTTVRALQAVPTQAISLLRERLRPVAPVADPKQLKRWIADLDANNFTLRDKAQQEIAKLGEAALPALRQALQGRPALEVKRRLQDLVAELEPKLVGGSPQRLRELRAVQVLESVGTAEARQVLQALAKGVSGARLTQEAEAALGRLAKRAVAKP